jgi:hypothetical protein
MVLVAPCYKPPKKKSKPWPKLACPKIDGDLLVDARALYEGSNLIAAAMTARVEIERQLTTLVLMYPEFGNTWTGIGGTLAWLNSRRLLRNATFVTTSAAADVGNRAAHGHPVTKSEVLSMFAAIDSLRHTVRRKGGAA